MKPINRFNSEIKLKAQSTLPGAEKAKSAPKTKAPGLSKDRVSLKGKQTPLPPKKWTVLAYLSGDCNLEEYMVQDLLDMEKIGSNKDMNLVAQLDRGDENATTQFSGGVKGAARYYVEEFKMKPGELDGFSRYNPATMPVLREKHTKITSPELKTLGQVNMADSKLFKDFLSWGMKNYPAKNYMIIAFGHGGGASGMITDEGAGPGEVIALPELRKAVKGAEKAAGVDKENVLMVLKSCQMSQTETAYELKDAASYLLASQSTIYANTWPMEEVFSEPGMENKTPEEMGRYLFNLNANRRDGKEISTLSFLDLSKAPKVGKAMTAFAQALKESPQDPIKLKKLMEIKSRPLFLANSEICHYNSDLYDAAQQIAGNPDPNDPAMLQAAKIYEQALKEKRNPKPDEMEKIQSLVGKAKSNNPGLNDPKLKKAAINLMSALDEMVLESHRNKHSFGFDKNALGLGILATTDPERFSNIGYQEQAFSKKTGWDEAMTSYAAGVTMEEMNRSLEDSQVRSKALKTISHIAAGALKDFNKLDKEFESYEKEISAIQDNPNKPPFKKFVEAFYQTYDLLTPMNKMAWAMYQQEKDKFCAQLFTEINSELIKAVAKEPKIVKDVYHGGMAVMAGMQGGKVNIQTLGKSARNLLHVKKEMEKDLSKADRKLLNDFMQETNRDKKVGLLEKLEKTESPVYGKARAMMVGLEMLYVLGYATRNEKFINVKNYSGFNQLALLKNLSEIGKTQAAG